MRVAVLATGGKDSTLALYRVLKAGYEVKCLACIIPQSEESWMFHYPNIGLVGLLAKTVKIPLVKTGTTGNKDEEVKDLRDLVEGLDVEGLVSGPIASTYQKTRIEKICQELKLECITPLWQRKPLDILEELLDLKFEAVITGVYAHGFSKEWLGRKIDEAAIADLIELNQKHGISLVGEGGEYETLVLDAPFYRKRIKVIKAAKIWKNQTGYYKITKAILQNK